MPEIGDNAPDFKLIATNGDEVSLSDLKGQKVVLYFYPKDNTPGCTKEACDIRDNFSEVKKYAIVYGISADDNKSHQKFAQKYNLPFQLLSDPDKQVLEKYGVWVQKSMFGKKYMGIQRATFLIDEEGKIKKVWPKVNVVKHIQEILNEIK
jgi:peroxiredoxin Q/BCP